MEHFNGSLPKSLERRNSHDSKSNPSLGWCVFQWTNKKSVLFSASWCYVSLPDTCSLLDITGRSVSDCQCSTGCRPWGSEVTWVSWIAKQLQYSAVQWAAADTAQQWLQWVSHCCCFSPSLHWGEGKRGLSVMLISLKWQNEISRDQSHPLYCVSHHACFVFNSQPLYFGQPLSFS